METTGGFTVVFQEIEDGYYFARCLEVPEAITQGATLDETRENIKDAISLILEDRREDAGREFEGRDDVIRERIAV